MAEKHIKALQEIETIWGKAWDEAMPARFGEALRFAGVGPVRARDLEYEVAEGLKDLPERAAEACKALRLILSAMTAGDQAAAKARQDQTFTV